MIRLLIADDYQVLLDGFNSIFDSIEDITVIGTAQNGKEVLEILKTSAIDVILLDINMPVLNGVETCKKLTKQYPGIKVIALSTYDQQSYFKRMMQYGAKGYLLKNDGAETIEKAIRMVITGGRFISPQFQNMLSSIDYLSGKKASLMGSEIAPKELKVLNNIASGLTDLQIADKLFLSFRTVNSHRKNLLLKLDAKNTAELIKKAMERGVL
ncbi:MAG: DNA-binding NarL/FixJ family response regulator [Saprospiraceae bacterium]|jgi:DNA-binding NarL/FixJ family response regulator